MAINILCDVCKSSWKLGATECQKCGRVFGRDKKYRVRVRDGCGKWLSKVVDRLSLAREIELEFKGRSARASLGMASIASKYDTVTMEDVWNSFWKHLQSKNLKQPGFYEKLWRVHIKPELGEFCVDEITHVEIEEFSIHLREKKGLPRHRSKEERGALSPRTISGVLSLLKQLLDHAVKTKLCHGEAPTGAIELPKFNNQVTNSLSHTQLKALLVTLSEWPNRMAALGFMLCLATGKRVGEVFSLRWSDVDWQHKMVKFTVKSRAIGETHCIPVNETSAAILSEALTHRIAGSDLVFHTCTGNMIYHSVPWKRIRKKAGIPVKTRAHDLRHTFATYLASSGKVDIYMLKNILGHKTIEMTMRYAKLMDMAMRKGIEVADDVLDGRPIESMFQANMPSDSEAADAMSND